MSCKGSIPGGGVTAGALLGLVAVVVLVFAALGSPGPATAPGPAAAPDPGTGNTPSARDSSDGGAIPSNGGSPSPSPESADPGPDLLLPDMRSLEPRDLQVERIGNGRRSLRFGAVLANAGPGPLLLRPVGDRGCPRGQHPASQLVLGDGDGDGRFDREEGADAVDERRDVGCMLVHPGHDHWHFDAMARYRLTRASDGGVVAEDGKVSFCLRDNERLRGVRTGVTEPHYGDCRQRGPQGISPGWVDVYDADLDGQALPLPRGVDRQVLCLMLEADPHDQLLEIDESDNATTVALRVVGDRVRDAPDRRCA